MDADRIDPEPGCDTVMPQLLQKQVQVSANWVRAAVNVDVDGIVVVAPYIRQGGVLDHIIHGRMLQLEPDTRLEVVSFAAVVADESHKSDFTAIVIE